VLIAGNADSLYQRLMSAIGRTDLRDDPALARNDGRAAQMERIDEAIAAWTSKRTQQQVLDEMDKAQVPAGRIYTAADIARDPHYQAREMVIGVPEPGLGGEEVRMQGVVPKLSETPGRVTRGGPVLGEHDDEVWGTLVGPERLAALRQQGVVQSAAPSATAAAGGRSVDA
jgi:crotonobetainyl-CoA:carnitine CoA-transferase CaiB-like acyl-CoA transferase